jgi:hypothetical protein
MLAFAAPTSHSSAQGAAGQGAAAGSTPVTRANWTLAERYSPAGLRNVVFSTTVQPRWLGQSDSMFYNWKDRTGARFYLVVPATKTKKPLFDHVKMAAMLSELHRKPYDPNNLPFTTVTFTKDHRAFRFTVDSSRYEWTVATEMLKSLPRLRRDSIPQDEERGGGGGGGGGAGGQPDFRNFSPDSTAFVFARDHNLFFVEVASKDTIKISTDGAKNYSFGFRDTATVQQDDQQQQQQDDEQGGGRGGAARSRDPRVRPQVIWSPDSKAFIAQRSDNRKVKELYLVNVLSNPRPTLSSYTYSMPGEENVPQHQALEGPARHEHPLALRHEHAEAAHDAPRPSAAESRAGGDRPAHGRREDAHHRVGGEREPRDAERTLHQDRRRHHLVVGAQRLGPLLPVQQRRHVQASAHVGRMARREHRADRFRARLRVHRRRGP